MDHPDLEGQRPTGLIPRVMLAALSIRDIVLIDKLDLEFGQGLFALTGETGAGKSILLDAFSLAIGARGDASLVRRGAAQGQVTATFELAPSHPVLRAARRERHRGRRATLILRRVQGADGRSRAFLNDISVSVQLLRQVGQALVEIHGQHDDRALDRSERPSRPGRCLRRLERRGRARGRGLRGLASGLSRRMRVMRAGSPPPAPMPTISAMRWKSFASSIRSAARRRTLASRRQLMMHAEKIAAELAEALDALQGEGTDGARLAAALRRIERQATLAGGLLAPIAEALERVLSETNAARVKIEEALAATAFEPTELERAEERLFALRAAARKHKVMVDDLPVLKERLEAELAVLDVSEGRAAELAGEAAAARKAYESAALTLSAARKIAAAQLDEEVVGELAPFKLEKASFLTTIETVPLAEGGPSGIDRVGFFVRTNPGTEAGPLMKVASGGELARFILALKVVLAARGSAPTLIFDEADAGVGGATAAAVGERLEQARCARPGAGRDSCPAGCGCGAAGIC